MVVVKVELWPHGDESKARPLGTAKISNDGSTLHDDVHGNYNVELSHSGQYVGRPGVWRRGRVTGHRRDLSPFHLVAKALIVALGMKEKW